MTSVDFFDSNRPLLFSIAYRMLGSASDAEDVVQDAWMRYSSADPGSIRSPKAFATTIVTRLCLDRLKSARATREEYIGPWLPEPLLTANTEAPDETVQRAESVTLAFLVLLETLSPEERAVFILKEACDCDHREIAATLGITIESSRQLLHRAKARVAAGKSQIDRHHLLEARGRKPVGAARSYLATASRCRTCSPPTSDCGAMAVAKCSPLVGRFWAATK